MMKLQQKSQISQATFKRTLGRYGESCAGHYLEINRYNILYRNFQTRHGEIDIIAQKDNIIAFVEVKFRQNKTQCTSELVPWRKQQKLIKTAKQFIIQNQTYREDIVYRFDVILMSQNDQSDQQILHIENAFFGEPC